jgi:hypothetical protein
VNGEMTSSDLHGAEEMTSSNLHGAEERSELVISPCVSETVPVSGFRRFAFRNFGTPVMKSLDS